ncbi:aminotransferase class III-fold pyridoxal phosphate-dependent enzyme [Mycolicibacterium sp. BiH015]|uniref:aspartate aminotransferase family protein n=1 Tax=Mycolicibacterium sp. BiH015 TaxID=3018808 RepID=UPI0022E813BD|nr:aminotransferase class III-fold pyridoxal phosphate-dependent enzyme [Mycolicibacterium sp. BiH015]MDA2893331.1 aminotransferase class III-fold pyridoxal phosphate-dependent enzyme [Mycolicibacterium sp. BiH015]
MTGSSVIDGNAFRTDHADSFAALTSEDRDLLLRRIRVLGPSYRLFYKRPVHIIRGQGSYLYGPNGEEYLDAYNNVASIGHAHPAVVEAVHKQMAQVNTHSRYLQRGIVEYSEQLLATFPSELAHVMFTNSGSEANDLALRVAQQATGGTGVVVTREAYHGTSAAASAISPAVGAHMLGPHVRSVEVPNSLRGTSGEDPGPWFAEKVSAAFADLRGSGVQPSAFIVDTIFSSDGVLPDPSVLGPAVAAARKEGAVFIADEVQPGFGRIGGHFWGFARHRVAPDLVTLGKPMGNGVPVAAMIATTEVLHSFGMNVPYFNTFGGSSVPVAAAQAVLNVIQSEGLAEHAEELGARILNDLRVLGRKHRCIGDVRGAGMFLAVEIVQPGTTQPDPTRSLYLVNAMRDRGVLISVAGPHSNVLKIRPLLSYAEADADRLVTTLAEALADLDHSVE